MTKSELLRLTLKLKYCTETMYHCLLFFDPILLLISGMKLADQMACGHPLLTDDVKIIALGNQLRELRLSLHHTLS